MDKQSLHIVNNKDLRLTRKYFENIFLPAFNDLSRLIEPIKKMYIIAGKKIVLNFYNKIIFEKMSKALSHNEEVFIGDPDLIVNLCDSFSSNINFTPPWENNEEYIYPPETNTKAINRDYFLGIYFYGEENICMYDENNNIAYFWTYNANQLLYQTIAAPLRPIFNWFLTKEKVHLMHGAVVEMTGKSVLLTARGGSGKSTTAISCLLSGMGYIGDDYISIKYDDIITAYSLFNSVKISPRTIESIFPELREKIFNKNDVKSDNEKAVIFLSEYFPKQVVRKAKLSAILIPIIKNTKKTKIISASKLETMLAIFPTTIFQLSLMESNKIAGLKSITEKVPCYFLELGRDIKQIPEVIKSFLANEQ